MLTQGIKTSTSTKHYATALEATYGGVDFFTKDALPQMLTSASSAFNSTTITNLYPTLNMTMPNTSNGCMQAKLTSTSASWLGAGCAAANLSSNIALLPTTADMTFTFPGTTGSSAYTVYSKIVDTAIGNTDTSAYASGGLLSGAGVGSGSGVGGHTASTKIPYLFTVEVQAQAAANPQETTRVTLLYAF
jgi:hypothetical protein